MSHLLMLLGHLTGMITERRSPERYRDPAVAAAVATSQRHLDRNAALVSQVKQLQREIAKGSRHRARAHR